MVANLLQKVAKRISFGVFSIVREKISKTAVYLHIGYVHSFFIDNLLFCYGKSTSKTLSKMPSKKQANYEIEIEYEIEYEYKSKNEYERRF